MPKIARADANQRQIVADLRRLGFKVAHTHVLGHGLPDILVAGYHDDLGCNTLVWVEIKSERGKLTPDERQFFDEWDGQPVIVARCAEDVLEWFYRVD